MSIDIVIGPILGFIIYKQNKKSLKFDLSVIFLIQFSALLFGFLTLFNGRPVWIVFNEASFYVVKQNEVLWIKSDEKRLVRKSSFLGPQFVAISSSLNNQENVNFIKNFEGISITQFPKYYVEFADEKKKIILDSYNLNVLLKFNKKDIVDRTLGKYPQANAWLPLKANTVDMVVLINKEEGEVIKIVDLRPWK